VTRRTEYVYADQHDIGHVIDTTDETAPHTGFIARITSDTSRAAQLDATSIDLALTVTREGIDYSSHVHVGQLVVTCEIAHQEIIVAPDCVVTVPLQHLAWQPSQHM
jgi:hypothetical protein